MANVINNDLIDVLQSILNPNNGVIGHIPDWLEAKARGVLSAVRAKAVLPEQKQSSPAGPDNLDLMNALQAFIDDMEGRFGEIPEDCEAYHNAKQLLSAVQPRQQ